MPGTLIAAWVYRISFYTLLKWPNHRSPIDERCRLGFT